MTGKVFTVSDDVSLWIDEGGSIHIKTRGPDPVELTEDDALELAAILTRLANDLIGN
jgi:hypothetical protein